MRDCRPYNTSANCLWKVLQSRLWRLSGDAKLPAIGSNQCSCPVHVCYGSALYDDVHHAKQKSSGHTFGRETGAMTIAQDR